MPPGVHQTAASAPGQPEVLFRPDLGPHAQVGRCVHDHQLPPSSNPAQLLTSLEHLHSTVWCHNHLLLYQHQHVPSFPLPCPWPPLPTAAVRVGALVRAKSARSCRSPASPSPTTRGSGRRSRQPQSRTTRCRPTCRPTGGPTRWVGSWAPALCSTAGRDAEGGAGPLQFLQAAELFSTGVPPCSARLSIVCFAETFCTVTQGARPRSAGATAGARVAQLPARRELPRILR